MVKLNRAGFTENITADRCLIAQKRAREFGFPPGSTYFVDPVHMTTKFVEILDVSVTYLTDDERSGASLGVGATLT